MMEGIREHQQVVLSILREVVKVCDNNNISYFLIEGSCLGAIRHKGFIPWDDDIDIAVFSNDYDLFFNTVENKLGRKYRIERSFDQRLYPTHTDILGKIENTEYKVRYDIFDNDERNDGYPGVDVMLICGCPHGKVKTNLFFHYVLFLKLLLKLSNRESIGFYSDKKRGRLERFVLGVFKAVDISWMLDENKISDMIKRALLKYNPHQSDLVFAYTSDYREKEIVPFSYYSNGRKTQFEDMIVSIPKKAEKYLTRIYGNYMEIPKEDQRHKHISKFI